MTAARCASKHHRHGTDLQVIPATDGEILQASGPLPGAVHDLNAARIWGTVREPATARPIVLAGEPLLPGLTQDHEDGQ